MKLFTLIHYAKKAVLVYETFSWKVARNTAFLLLAVMFLLMYAASKQESAIMDELAHIPAGYSYLAYGDMRINPEHPPLLKDIAAFPLIVMDLRFPETAKSWTQDLNGQWDLGRAFLYRSGNDPDRILFWSRMGPMLATVLLGWFVWRFGVEWFGVRVALLALALFAFSPALLAHGKYVTTDVAAAFGFFIGIAWFLQYVKAPTQKNLLKAGIAFGVAQTLKFSLILLIPFLFGVALLWALTNHPVHTRRICLASVWQWIKRTAAVFAIGYIAIVWPLYQLHVWNYPMSPINPDVRQEILDAKGMGCPDLDKTKIGPSQFRDTVCNLKTFRPHVIADIVVWASDKPLMRPLAQYAHGVLMVGQRTVGGNTTYFLGEVSRDAWRSYFPIVYLIKEPLAFHLLTFAAIFMLASTLRKRFREKTGAPFLLRASAFVQEHFIQITIGSFILFYWTASIAGNLNIGVRHLMPVFPFTFLLVAQIILNHLRQKPSRALELSLESLKELLSFWKRKVLKYAALCAVLLWYVISVIVQYPYLTAHFNELAGGPNNGWKYVADSNLDWGQDLKRLAAFVEKNNIDKIRLDYFGGGSPEYYLGNKFEGWWSARGAPPSGSWFAVSASFRDGAFGAPIGRFERPDSDSYVWLRDKTPVTVIGHSIFVYKLE